MVYLAGKSGRRWFTWLGSLGSLGGGGSPSWEVWEEVPRTLYESHTVEPHGGVLDVRVLSDQHLHGGDGDEVTTHQAEVVEGGTGLGEEDDPRVRDRLTPTHVHVPHRPAVSSEAEQS